MSSCRILWSTQSGRAKACARRTARILREETTLEVKGAGSSFDETPEPFIEFASKYDDENTFLLLFVSTTGDGEHCDSIRDTWHSLLQKSLSRNLFQGKQFAMFCLGDRAYGPQFCAAGRKLAVRLLQLGMTRTCEVGYGDDNTPIGGVFRDLDVWLEKQLLPLLEKKEVPDDISANLLNTSPFEVEMEEKTNETGKEEWQQSNYESVYRDYFSQFCPVTAYAYDSETRRKDNESERRKSPPLLGTVLANERITGDDWHQDTRHIQIQLHSVATDLSDSLASLPYCAGDVATVLPFNSDNEVDKFLAVLPESVRSLADTTIHIKVNESAMNSTFTLWPRKFTFRGWLKYCADIHSLPEREDLRALSPCCSMECESGKSQSEKLRSLSETSEAALYADYILREKRSWADVLYDFESLRAHGSKLTLEALLVLLPPMLPRDFSIASAPSSQFVGINKTPGSKGSFVIELCVAVVQGRTPLKRSYHGLCSEYLSRMMPTTLGNQQEFLQVWIRPGSFSRLPLNLNDISFDVPILCVGAGTGIAPMRSLLMERDAIRAQKVAGGESNSLALDENENILIFGCRKQLSDFYYQEEWKRMCSEKRIRLLTAFSRDQFQKIYVQKVLGEADGGRLIAEHLLEHNGALYIAGGPKMARAVKEEVIEALGAVLEGGEKRANQFLNKLHRVGKFSIEAWG